MFRTDDLALTAYLSLNGYEHATAETEGKKCFWKWPVETSRMRELIDEYFAGEAFVEPREFQRKIAQVRKGIPKYQRAH